MVILPIHPDVADYLKRHGLERRFQKQLRIFKDNLRHPGLEVELLEPRHLRIYSFRIDRKYRVIFIFRDSQTVEVIDVNNHYQC